MCEREKKYVILETLLAFSSEMKGSFFSHMNRPGPSHRATDTQRQGRMSEDCGVQLPGEAESATVDCSERPPVQFEFCQGWRLKTFLVKLFPIFYLSPLVPASGGDVLQSAHCCCFSPPL